MIDALKKFGARALAHVQEHKLLYGVGALGAGLGYLFVSSQASAAPKLPLPAPKPVVPPAPLPGPLPVVTQQSPALLAHPGDIVHVTTQTDALNARSGPGANYAKVGSYPKGGFMSVLGAAQNGFLHVQGPGVDLKGNQLAVLEGWASADFLGMGAGNATDEQVKMAMDALQTINNFLGT